MYNIWPFAHNWTNKPSVVFTYSTATIVSYTGIEQRISFFESPRVSFSINHLLSKGDVGVARSLLAKTQGETIIVPDWTRKVGANGWVSDSPSEQLLSVEFDDFFAGGPIAVALMGAEYSQVHTTTATAATPGVISVEARPDFGFVSSVIPVSHCRAMEGTSVEMISGDLARISATFDSQPELGPHFFGALDALQYRGYYVLDMRSNWSKSPTVELTTIQESFDEMTGIAHYQKLSPATVVLGHTYTLFGREQIAWFESFMHEHLGRCVPFFCSSRASDYILNSEPAPADTEITIAYAGMDILLSIDDRQRFIEIRWADGSATRRQVLSSIRDGDSELLALDEAVGPVGIVDTISDLHFCRFETDTFKYEYISPSIAEITKKIRSLRYEPV